MSNVAGDKPRENNPNIPDLSDQNRPTKLAEMYSELYDNRWTDAFEILTKVDKTGSDRNAIDFLLESLMVICFCFAYAENITITMYVKLKCSKIKRVK